MRANRLTGWAVASRVYPMASYTITIAPSIKGQVTATASNGHAFTTTTPLLSGARYWQQLGAPSSATITTVWSSGSPDWTLRATIGRAAKLTVAETTGDGRPRFAPYRPFPDQPAK